MTDGPTPSTPSTPGWQPDPSGRHELRWFDGTAFTDQVADAGVRSTDPGLAAATTSLGSSFGGAPPPPLHGLGAPPPPGVGGVAPPSDMTGRRGSRVPVILGVLGALVVVVALVALLSGGGDGGGDGSFEGEVADGEEGVHDISIPAGSVAVIELDPSSDLDAIVEIEVEGDDEDNDEDAVEDLYEGTVLEDPDRLFRRDVGFDGEEEQLFLAVPFDVDATVVVSGFEDSEGTYEITITFVELDVDEDADGDDLIDAVLDSDDVPRSVRSELESLLTD